jgi:hypothetical protein
MIKKLRVAVDHGNRNMKTCNFVFTTGLTEQDKKPARGEKYLKYQGKYYTLSEKRIPYQRDLVLTIICPVPRSSWNFADISKNTDHAEQWNSYGLVQKRKVCLEVGTILKNMKQNFRLIVSI